jgi:hypothetical protein
MIIEQEQPFSLKEQILISKAPRRDTVDYYPGHNLYQSNSQQHLARYPSVVMSRENISYKF